MKVLASHLGEDDRARLRFAREARTAAGLSSHPHVVTIYDVGEYDGKSFIVMELIGGGTVADRLRAGDERSGDERAARGRIPHRVALRWLSEAGSALDAAHEAGIVHRDVKPANMLLDTQRTTSAGTGDKERLAIADFGIARLGLEDQITQTGQVLGTAAYISPEQAMGEPATAASDRYALAVVAFELLTGSKPFTAENFAAQARAHVDDEPPRASDLDLDVTLTADRVLARGMAKEPEDRCPSAGAMVRELDDALATPPPRRRAAVAAGGDATRVMGRTPPPAPPARTGSPPGGSRRGWGVGALIGLAALVLVVAGAVALMSGGEDPPADRPARDEPRATATATATAEATATPEATATATPEPTEEPAAEEEPPKQPKKEKPKVSGDDPAALQLQAYNLNNAGQPEQALPYAQQAVELCQGSTEVTCAYALFEYAKALRLTGDPQGAINALEERKQRFPDNQPGAVERELALAREAAGGGDD